jgi:hypothetical protein
MAFRKREQSFRVLEYARTLSVVIALAAYQDNYVRRVFLEKISKLSLSVGIRSTTIRCAVYLWRIFKMFHRLMNKPVLQYINNFQQHRSYPCLNLYIYIYIYIYIN